MCRRLAIQGDDRPFVAQRPRFVRSEIEPRRVFAELLQRDILIRDVSSYPMLKDYFRVSVGTPAENDLLVSALREIYTNADCGMRIAD